MGADRSGSRDWVVLGVGVVALTIPALLLPRARTAKEWIGDLKRGDAQQRMTAAYALRHGEPEHLPYTLRALLEIVRSAEPHLSEMARESARRVAAEDIGLVVELFEESGAEDVTTRSFCEGVLLNHPQEAVGLLVAVVEDPKSKASRPAAQLLARMGEPALEPLSKLLWDDDQDTRLLAAWALGIMGEPARSTLGLLKARIHAPTGLERRTALEAMRFIDPGHEKTLQLAEALLGDKAIETRRAALLCYFEGWLSRLDRERADANAAPREVLGEPFEAALERLLDDFDAHAANGGRPPD
ncbi:MAG: HEAT repeat domain-containing protein [Planctomycetota bacterium]|jgi:hypothetical protein|nr:HEAT repeat domain-containing protein [Planctomycetota bacterium]MDP6763357.1 HEAT repeat domain-containing protein [Planctomycetota bacterium]MDP6988786.1 HEAT repeat domain-containing protein [Planctomycetota bacterium]